MTADLLLLALGLALLVAGAESLVRGAVELAARSGVSPLVVGLTVVAFGSSAPELAVNVGAALSDRGAITLGNVLGSNIANVGLALGSVALLRPIAVERSAARRQIPTLVAGTLAALLLASGADAGDYSRADGVVLLALFALFLGSTLARALRRREPARPATSAAPGTSVARSWALALLGLSGLGLGGHLTVESASSLALELGVSPALVGLTVVAVGTSLPEIVTAWVGVLRGADSIALGNVIGANLFNLLFVLGTSACLRPVPVPEGGRADLLVALAFALALGALALPARRRIGRAGGLLLVAGYAAFIAWRTLGGAA